MLRELGPLARPVLLLVILLVVGSAGYVLIEGYPLLDAVFMTVTTLATVGYGEIHPLGPGGRLFTTVLILVGVGSALFTLTELVRFVYEGQLGQALWRRRMDRHLKELSDHFILCGYGRVGRQIAADLEQSSVPFVVVDRDPVGLRLATERGLMVVEGDAGSDDVLRMAGVERARGLVTAVAEDADNIYVTLSARALNGGLRIVARANADESISKLQRAGADQVVSPYSIGGRRMAMLALRPLSVEFVDAVVHGETGDLLLEDMELLPGSRLVGRSIDDVQTVLAPGVSVLALKRDAAILARPPGETSLLPGDELVVIGTQDQLGLLERMG
ncbi:MAG: potassium channel protein [Chloroflexi bacterium]|nr:potassium channel protein [Chloroflexota bacterium]